MTGCRDNVIQNMLSLFLRSTNVISRSYQSLHSATSAARKSTMAQQPRYMNGDVRYLFVIRTFQFQVAEYELHKGTCRAHEERESTQQGFPGRRRSRR